MSVASFHRLTAAQPNLSHDPHRHHAHAFEAIARHAAARQCEIRATGRAAGGPEFYPDFF
jgi:hypothetical protein